MLLKKWSSLPIEMINKDVEDYYRLLKKKTSILVMKRVFDIVFAILLILLLSPIFLIVSILIKIDSKGSIFYRQTRVTQYNRDFRIFKFRTMVSNADKIGTLVTQKNDQRITKIGNKIRKSRLDELPQLFNILLGDMSFVGTRPEVRRYVDTYSNDMMATLLLPAGVTSLASIKFKDEDEIISSKITADKDVDMVYINEVLPIKMRYNLEYLASISILHDIKICIRTVSR